MLTRDWSIGSQLTYAQHDLPRKYITGDTHEESISDGNTVDGAPKTLANTRLRYKFDERTHISFDWEHVGNSSWMPRRKCRRHNIFAKSLPIMFYPVNRV